MFLLLAGHVAAMAPGTHVGAAHPVQAGGGDLGDVMGEKVVNDVAAMARALAAARGRDASWAERAVRESVSATADEAEAQGVIDVLAPDLDALLAAVHGRTVATPAGETRLETRDAPRARSGMTLPERILQAVVHPNIAYLLFTIGLIGIIAELYTPGLLFPGITGAIALLLAFAGFGVLPVSWAGILLIVGGIALVAIEVSTEGIGVLGVGGAVAFVAGSLLLYSPMDPAAPAIPDLRVSGWLVATLGAAIAAFFGLVGRALLRTRRIGVATGIEALIGRIGVATSDLLPAGTVSVGHEAWTAIAQAGPIARGERVRVLGIDGVRLRVARAAP
jgi:membrane-bound serine protease (ClpP class)